MGWLMLVPFSVAVSNAVFTMREESTTWDTTSARAAALNRPGHDSRSAFRRAANALFGNPHIYSNGYVFRHRARRLTILEPLFPVFSL